MVIKTHEVDDTCLADFRNLLVHFYVFVRAEMERWGGLWKKGFLEQTERRVSRDVSVMLCPVNQYTRGGTFSADAAGKIEK